MHNPLSFSSQLVGPRWRVRVTGRAQALVSRQLAKRPSYVQTHNVRHPASCVEVNLDVRRVCRPARRLARKGWRVPLVHRNKVADEAHLQRNLRVSV
eukprot:6182869-Pleurochrysis_carterae.AAC.3